MSVVIRGMDKPTDCGLCPFEDFGYCAVKGERNTSEKGIDDDCPLVEIKEYTLKNGHKVVVADTPQTDCNGCEHWKYIAHEWQCETIKCQGFRPRQTDCGWK